MWVGADFVSILINIGDCKGQQELGARDVNGSSMKGSRLQTSNIAANLEKKERFVCAVILDELGLLCPPPYIVIAGNTKGNADATTL